jgi:hypothetical protein
MSSRMSASDETLPIAGLSPSRYEPYEMPRPTHFPSISGVSTTSGAASSFASFVMLDTVGFMASKPVNRTIVDVSFIVGKLSIYNFLTFAVNETEHP